MGWKIWQKKKNSGNLELSEHPILVRPFYLISVTLLSLLLPLSFLLLARLSSAHYIMSLASNMAPKSFFYSIFLYTNPNILHALVSLISLGALINGFTGKIRPLNELHGPIFQPRLHAAWIFLCTLQVCVGLGIEATIKAGVDGAGFSDGRSILSKLIFFVGLHETMIYWSRTIVRPVVDDTVYGGSQEERWVDRWALAASFGALSWWRLRDEVESLVVVMEVKRDMMMRVGLGDFLSWSLYYMTVAIGMARIIKGIMWVIMFVICRRRVDHEDHGVDLVENHEDKV